MNDSKITTPEQERIVNEAGEFDARFRQDHPYLWWGSLFGPVALTALILGILAMEYGKAYVRLIVATAFATFFFFGRFVILGGEHAEESTFLSPEALVAMVLFMDLITAVLIGFHAGVMWRLPIVGRRLHQLVVQGQILIARNPRVKRATFLTIVAFVMFPLAATGSIGGSLFARLLGMGRVATLLAVLIGSLLGCGLMYYGATLINRYLDRSNPLVTIGGIACVVAIIAVLTRRFQKMASN